MASQNIYDDPDFLAGYASLGRQVHGLAGAAEWPTLRSLMPDLRGKDVVDLGCGFGWHSRWAADQHAASVVGVDISTKMLERARAETASPRVGYVCADLDSLQLEPDSVDVVISSLALHYVQDLGRLLSTVATAMRRGGSMVFSVEHPISSAATTKEFETSERGDRIWPLDNYLVEGQRVTNWFVDGVVKEHRTVATYVNTIVSAGFAIDRMVEWGPSTDDISARPEMADDRHRPWFLLLLATKRAR